MNNLDNFDDRPLFTIAYCNNEGLSFEKKQSSKTADKLGVGIFKEGDDTDASKKDLDEKDESKKIDWRNMPSCDVDWMIISSYGDEFDPSIEVSYKEQKDDASNRMMLARKEMEAVLDACSKDSELFLKHVCPDFPGVQFSKKEHMERIKRIMLSRKKEGVLIWYTGHSEKDTGNWCFKDGVISFQDVFGLYLDHMRGKCLTIVSDCSYSGNWIKQCAEKLDEKDIPACGHHARKQGILLKIFPSCKANEKATINCFVEEGIVDVSDDLRFNCKTLTSGQTSLRGNFRRLHCSSELGPCDVSSKWCDRLMIKKQLFKVTGKDRGQPAWHYVLVDEDKLEEYYALFCDRASPQVDVAKYGKVLESGWGEQPPKDVVDKFGAYYMEY